MHSLQGSRWVRLILGTMAVAACTREAPNREGEAKGGAIVPSRFTQLTVVRDRLWVTTDAGIVVIEPVAEKWALLDFGSHRIVPTSVVSFHGNTKKTRRSDADCSRIPTSLTRCFSTRCDPRTSVSRYRERM